ncbi:MAG: protein kinase [Armatimonadetes bacterium]|nr:protein kinase [Armatimonadota bacterium]
MNPPTLHLTQSRDLSSTAAASEEPDHWKAGDVLFGRFEILDRIGKGGMGAIYRVNYWDWGQEMAVKVPHRSLMKDREARERWIVEAHTWVGLGVHPNIVRCWFVREWQGVPLLFLDYITGGSLGDWMGSGCLRTRDWPSILNFAIQACDGLAYAHSFGLIHRDVKPGNLLIGPDEQLLVTDFGVVKRGLEDKTAASPEAVLAGAGSASLTGSTLLGTPAYAAPEQWKLEKVGPTADVYGLAVVIYEMCCGRLPFEYGEGGLHDLLLGHLLMLPPDPAQFNPEIPEALKQAILGCLAKEPSARPQSMADLRRQLCDAYRQETGQEYPRETPEPGPQRGDGLNNKAVSLWYLGKDQEAFKVWAQAAQLDALHPETVFNRSMLRWRQGQLTREEVLRRLRSVQADHPWVGAYVGRFLLECFLPQAAEPELRAALAHPEAAAEGGVWRALGDARMSEERFSDAAAAYSTALELSPNDRETAARLELARSGSRMSPEGRICFPLTRARHVLRLPTAAAGLAFWGDSVLCRHRLALDCWHAESGSLRWSSVTEGQQEGLRIPERGGYALAGAEAWKLETGERLARPSGENLLAMVPGTDLAISVAQLRLSLVRLPHNVVHRGLSGHDGLVRAVAVSPDGRRAVSGSTDRSARVWDLSSGACVTELLGHRDHLEAIAITPDGSLALTGARDGEVRLWMLARGARLDVWKHSGRITDLEVTADGKYVLVTTTGPAGPRIALWALAERSQLFERPGRAVCGRASEWLLGWSPTERGTCEVAFWELPTGRVIRSFGEHPAPPEAVAASDDGKWVACAQDGHLHLWEADEGHRLVERSLLVTRARGHREGAEAGLQFSQLLQEARASLAGGEPFRAYQELHQARAVPGYDRDPEAMALMAELLGLLPRCELRSAWEIRAFRDPAGKDFAGILLTRDGTLAAAACGKAVRLWDPRSGSCLRGFIGHRKQVTCLHLSSDEARLGTGGLDGTARLWDVRTGNSLATFEHDGAVTDVQLLKDGVLTCTQEGRVHLWPGEGGGEARRLFARAEGTRILASRDGQWLLLQEGNRLSVGSLGARRPWDLAVTGNLCALAFLEGQSKVVAATESGQIEVLDLARRRGQGKLSGHRGPVRGVAVTAGAPYAASVSDDWTARLWRVDTCAALGIVGHPGPLSHVALDQDARYLLTSSQDGWLRLWELDWGLSPPPSPSRPGLLRRLFGLR